MDGMVRGEVRVWIEVVTAEDRMAKRRSDDNEWVDDDPDDREFEDHELEDHELEDHELEETDQDEVDQKRFSGDVAYCPECGAEILDDADICPKCFTWIDGTTHSRPSKLRRSLKTAVVVLLIAAAAIGCVGFVLIMR